jgi:cobyrinic acid a,c-diamide synthase
VNGFVLAGTHSGVGKTVATLAVIRALQGTGHEVQPAKAGPDFIDPSHHEAVADRPSRTLDPWLQGPDGLRRNYARGDGDLCVIEGVMGLYDGERASTARVAECLDLPVVLVCDASGGMESLAATAVGFREYATHAGRDIDVVGILAQRAHGGRHARGIREALPDDLTYVGRVPPDDALAIPDRHLGLHMGSEAGIARAALDGAADAIEVDRLIDHATPARDPERAASPPADTATDAPATRVAVARDAAFCFTYPATIERLRERASVSTFSPLAGDPIPDGDAIYLPGGYPEVHADTLAASPTLDDLHSAATDGVPIYGECGGLMALADTLTTAAGETVDMAGVLPADVEMADRYQALDHVELSARGDQLTAPDGATRRGHEFHYSSAAVDGDASFAFDVAHGTGIDGDHDGLTAYRTLGTYCHLHPESGAFDTFLTAAAGEGA